MADSDNGPDQEVTDEEILNVFRRADSRWLSTANIADHLPITQDWTGKRLNELETLGRVNSQAVGQARIWRLGEDEIKIPIDPRSGTWGYRLAQLNDVADGLFRGAKACGFASMVLVFALLTIVIAGSSTPFVSSGEVLVAVYSLLAAGAISSVLGAVFLGFVKLASSLFINDS